MSRIEDLLVAAVQTVLPKPPASSAQATKKNWNQALSNALALAIAEELRRRGMKEARPSGPGQVGNSGAERRLSGGIGAKKVDVTWATEESGLLFGGSVKTIMWRDSKTKAFQKNLTNRRGDMLVEAVSLHRRFPYAVLAGFLFMDAEAEHDHTTRRKSTFVNAFPRLRLFTRRPDPSGREEQYERLYLLLVDTNAFQPSIRAWEVHDPTTEVDLEVAFDDIVTLLGERNFDFYDGSGGVITRA